MMAGGNQMMTRRGFCDENVALSHPLKVNGQLKAN